jgi:hypothetical protein
VRKAEKAAANDSAFVSEWYPPIERHSAIVQSEQPDQGRCRNQEITRDTGSVSKLLVPGVKLWWPAAPGKAFRG